MKLNDVILEAASPAQQAAIAISMKKAGKKPKQGVAEGSRDRRDAYQRDYDSSVSGMGKRDSYAYSQDGGGNDERHDLDPSDWYIVKDGKMYKTSVYPRQEREAISRGYSRTRDEAKAKASEQGVAEGSREMTGSARDQFISTMTPRVNHDALMQKVAKVVNSPEFDSDNILKIVDAGDTITHPVGRYIQKEFDELQYDLGREYEDYPEQVAEKLLSMLIARTKQGVAEGKADYNFDIEDLKRLEQIRDLSTLKAQALALISKPSAKPMKPEKVEWFKNALERMNSPLKVIKLMYDLLLSGEGKAVVGSRSSMNPNSYRQRFSEQGVAEDFNGEYDDEAGMADNNLETLQRAVEGIDDLIQSGDNLPEWCQEKIAVAKSMLVAVWDYMYSEEASDEVDPEVDEMFEAMQELVAEMAVKNRVSEDLVWEQFEAMPDNVLYETAAWRRKEGKSKKGGLNAKGVASYRRENPGSKLQMAVTTKPSKLKKGSKASKRRKSFCARMSGVKGPMKKPNGKPTRKALALRKWNC